MGAIPATEFKAKCLELMDRVAERHETFIITKRGKPVAKLAPVGPERRETLFGCMKGKFEITGDIVNPAAPREFWETVKEWDELVGKPVGKSTASQKASRKARRRRT